MSGFIAVGHFLVSLFFGLVLLLLWARMFLRYFKISPLHPVSQMINTFADPLIKPVQGLIPSDKAHPSRYDWACLAVIFIVEVIKYILLSFFLYGTMMPLTYLFVFVLADLISQPCNLLFYLILIRVVMSWVKPDWHHPVEEVIRKITDPLLALGRYLIPDISGFDFSPFIIMIILKAIVLFMSASLPLRLI
ncbi:MULTISPECIES: YggT family protein [Legionella]|uniref:YggT family protein n=1 Tax=Legionella maceachernii TaxID=466 RepID=A0A0W0VWL8_9GAMM|nr:YggT family protein [Legionella maceachernii]KTD24485.1 YggT family protein [Legionella maceachernii]SJZ60221.1 YggT family protein [Legionella maceachernii]SUP00829.1 YGGT family [Legionella maceachernii]